MREGSYLGTWARAATAHTCATNAALVAGLDFGNAESFDDARRGFLGSVPDARVTAENGELLWDLSRFAFLEAEAAPDSVNRSLWRQARLNNIHGLFEVVPGLYQVRGFDIANMTIVEGDSGIVVIDPLMVAQTARAAIALYRRHRGERPVRAVIYSHSHPDHYGGVEGVISPDDAASGRVPVIAPYGFLDAAISETILAGVPMRRRAMFQFGPTLDNDPRAHVDSGLGKSVPRGSAGLIAPTLVVTEPTERHVIDGVEIVFQLTPETEAPSEMNFFFPRHRVLDLAENGCHTMHNLCPIRGARTRDALAWSKYLDAALDAFVEDTEVVIAQHHWPTFGRERVRRFIVEQRDMYRYLHDQTLRLMSRGYTPHEIADAIRMPAALGARWHTRPYYGAIAHNVRAIYAHYMGPYDGNPASLNPLAPQPGGRKYVEYMGGARAVLERARRDFDAGQYRWVVQVLHHVIFADSGADIGADISADRGDNTGTGIGIDTGTDAQALRRAARELAADAMEQLGYQSESSTWRNAYLLGAKELRIGAPKPPVGGVGVISPRVVAMMPISMFFDFLAIRVDGERAEGLALRIDWQMSDERACYRLTLSNSALSHAEGSHGGAAQAVVSTDRRRLGALLASGRSFSEAPDTTELTIDGDRDAVRRLFDCFEQFDPMFNIVEP